MAQWRPASFLSGVDGETLSPLRCHNCVRRRRRPTAVASGGLTKPNEKRVAYQVDCDSGSQTHCSAFTWFIEGMGDCARRMKRIVELENCSLSCLKSDIEQLVHLAIFQLFDFLASPGINVLFRSL